VPLHEDRDKVKEKKASKGGKKEGKKMVVKYE